MKKMNGWKLVEIGEVAEVVTGNTPSRKSPHYFGGSIPWVKPPDVNNQREVKHSEEYLSDEGAKCARILPKGSVMVTCIGNIGNVAIAGTQLATNQQINSIVIKDENILPKYVYYQALTWKKWLYENSTSTTISMINKSRFSKAPFILAPLPEQKRIVAKLDTLFAHLDQLRSRLDKIPVLLKQFRQAVLTQAVTGKLTEEWRNTNKFYVSDLLNDLFVQRTKLIERKDDKDLDQIAWNTFEIPDSWKWVHLWDIAYMVTSGSRDWSKYYSSQGAYFIRSAEINNNSLRLEEAIFVSLPENAEGKRSLVEKGNLLVTITGANVGKCAKIDQEIPEAYVSQSVALVKLVDADTTDYVHLTMLAPKAGADQLSYMAYGMGRPVLSLPQIKSVYVPLPPIQEQKEIVRRVQSLFAIADDIEAYYDTVQKNIVQLPKAVLSKAFGGELT